MRPRVVPDIFQLSLGSVDIEAINGIPVIGIKESSLTGFNLAVKRAFDIVFSVLLGLLSPACMAADRRRHQTRIPRPGAFQAGAGRTQR